MKSIFKISVFFCLMGCAHTATVQQSNGCCTIPDGVSLLGKSSILRTGPNLLILYGEAGVESSFLNLSGADTLIYYADSRRIEAKGDFTYEFKGKVRQYPKRGTNSLKYTFGEKVLYINQK
ncbi:hypothetical protein V6R21_24030 [Limibacter armeniacum]|uniref:hypothetical protein n=1 Tax=Limibacter armeniacum TaxID=466084 RepID=UPI002FE62237